MSVKDLATKNTKDTKKVWPKVRLGDVCEVRAGATHHEIVSDTGKYPVYGSGGYICQATTYRCPANTVTIGRKGTLDKPLLIEEPFWNIDTCFGAIPNEALDAEYLWRFCQNFDFYKLIPAIGRPSTNSDAIKSITIPLPPLSVQRAIVARLEKELGEADKLAAKFKRVAELADDAFKAELDETFKALEDNSRRDAETRRVSLGDVCKVLTDGDWIESKDQSETGIRLIQTGNVGNGVFERKDNRARYISVATFAKLNCTEIYCGDILISRLPEPVGRACIVEDVGCRMITAVDCSIVRFKDTIEPKFFIHYSQSSKYRSQISSQLTGTTRARISRKHLSSVLIACPPISIQRAIIAKLDAAKERCEKLKAAAMRGLAAAENLRKAILAEAFEQ